MIGKLLLVEFNLQLCTVFITAYLCVAGAFDILHYASTQLLCEGSGLVEVVAEYLNLQRVVASSAHTALRYLEVDQFGVLVEALAQVLLHIENAAVAVVFLGAAYRHTYLVVSCAVEQSGHTCIVVRTGRGGDYYNIVAKQFLDVGLHMTGGFESLFNTGTALQFGTDADAAVILLFHKVHTYLAGGEWYHRHNEEREGDQQRHTLVVQAPAQHIAVPLVDSVEHTSDGFCIGETFFLLFQSGFFLGCFGQVERLLLEHQAREHRDECDGRCCRNTHDNGDNPA